jgi:type II secretion system protein N
MIQLTDPQRRILRYAGYPLLALVTFVSAAWASFDASRLRARAVDTLSRKYDVTIERVDKGILPGSLSFSGLVLKTRPKTAEEKPTPIVIDKVDVDVGVLSLLFGSVSVDLAAELGGGEIAVEIDVGSDELAVEVETNQLEVSTIPGADVLFAGLPAKGVLDATVELTMPKIDGSFSMAKANGEIRISCANCSVGPGKVKADPAEGNAATKAFAREGMTLPQLNLGENEINVQIVNGHAEIKKFRAVSKDGEVHAEGYIDFKSPISVSEIQQCYRFKFTEEAKKREPTLGGIEMSMMKAQREDGFFGMRMTGTIAAPHRVGSRMCKPGQSPAEIRRLAQEAQRREAGMGSIGSGGERPPEIPSPAAAVSPGGAMPPAAVEIDEASPASEAPAGNAERDAGPRRPGVVPGPPPSAASISNGSGRPVESPPSDDYGDSGDDSSRPDNGGGDYGDPREGPDDRDDDYGSPNRPDDRGDHDLDDTQIID